MLHSRFASMLLLIGLCMATCLICTSTTLGVCTQIAYDSSMTACPYCACQGPCACIPPGPWGYTIRQWRPWPGGQYRQDIVFPQSIGVERIVAPRGEQPKSLPREKYTRPKTKAERDAEANSEIQIREGAPLEQFEMPLPLD